MWNKFFGLIKLVYDFGEDTKKNTAKIKDLEAEVQRMADSMSRMAYEIRRLNDEMGHFKNSESSRLPRMKTWNETTD